MSLVQKLKGIDWGKMDSFCSLCALIGFFGVVGGFYFLPGYGEVARVYYLLILLPALFSAPLWFRRVSLFSWSWLFFLLPIVFLALSVFWVGESEFNTQRSHWYFFKPLLLLVFLFLAAQIVIEEYSGFEQDLIQFVTMVALITGLISLSPYLSTALEKDYWPRMGGMSVNGDINVTASLYGINIFFCAYGLVKWSAGWFWPLLASLSVSLVVVLLTQSKVPLAYLFVALGWLIIKGFQDKKFKKMIPIIVVSALIFIFIWLYVDRIPFLYRVGSLSVRMDLWLAAIEQSSSHWWFGHGVASDIKMQLGGKEFPSHAHNYIVDTLRYGGVMGDVLLSAQTLFVAQRGFALIKAQPQYLPIVAWFYMGVLFLLTNGQQPLVKPHHIWFFYWLPLVFILAKDLQQAKKLNR